MPPRDLDEHARQSLGASSEAIYEMVASALADRGARGELVADVGCGTGRLWTYLAHRFTCYAGLDAVRHEGFPSSEAFHRLDLDAGGPLPLPDASADAVVAVETIEHLENPRSLMRLLVRLARPGAWVVVTTPNQRSVTSLLTLVLKGRFGAFQDPQYPAHITALLDVDLQRIGAEAGLVDGAIRYSRWGRVPLTRWHYPRALSAVWPRALSDNLLFIGRKPPAGC